MRLATLIFFLTCIVSFSCEEIGTLPQGKSGELEEIVLENFSSIPSEYGELISVTTHAQYEGWSQLWFVDDQRTIRMVRVQFHQNRIHENVLVIPRN